MKRTLNIAAPIISDYIRTEQPVQEKQDEFNPEAGKIALSELSKEEAEEYANLLKQSFLAKWNESQKG